MKHKLNKLPGLRAAAALALDQTHAFDNRVPRTYLARQKLAIFLDIGTGTRGSIIGAIRWLQHVAEHAKPRGVLSAQFFGTPEAHEKAPKINWRNEARKALQYPDESRLTPRALKPARTSN